MGEAVVEKGWCSNDRRQVHPPDTYIKALGLKGVFKGLVDIQTPEIWFEAKESPTPPLPMFAQLLVYVWAARRRGEAIPGLPDAI